MLQEPRECANGDLAIFPPRGLQPFLKDGIAQGETVKQVALIELGRGFQVGDAATVAQFGKGKGIDLDGVGV